MRLTAKEALVRRLRVSTLSAAALAVAASFLLAPRALAQGC